MQIAICDDEKEIRELLGDKVKNLYPEAALTFYAAGEELLASKERPDILFLDIQMPGKNGMETAEELRRKWRETVLIFVTALEEYVFQAFDVGAFHYLVKPFTDEKFAEVLKGAADRLEEIKSLRGSEPEKYIMVYSRGSHVKVPAGDIVYAEVFNRKVVIHTTDENIEYYGKLSELEKSLGEDFYRPHRAYLIHFKYVTKYDGASVTMKNGKVLMAKAKFSEFVRNYLKYNQRKRKENG